jgi:cellulose synthase/poly-beta-1,6-N-acetylglucosamine synthase-like glycosyltransferase
MEFIIYQADYQNQNVKKITPKRAIYSSVFDLKQHKTLLITISTMLLSLGVLALIHVSIQGILTITILITTIVMTLQGLFHFYLMIYAWEDTFRFNKKETKRHLKPKTSFSAIVPARYEARVIEQTIRAIDRIDYPTELKEILVVCRFDDEKTIQIVKKVIDDLGRGTISLITFYDDTINKPHALNIGLDHAQHDYVVVFDAEDHPHKNIYKVINDKIHDEKPDVIQSGVQLMNYRSSWFAPFSVLEYYFWFKSILHFFAKKGAIPLAGNTVFIKKSILKKIKGWDETCLTEDAELGIRLSVLKAKIAVVYHEAFVTREETPASIKQLIKQRTRWNQGFLQILQKQSWRKLATSQQVLLAFYFLSLPSLLAFVFLFIPFSLVSSFTFKLPVIFALLSFLPILVLGLQIVTSAIAIIEFTKDYHLKLPVWMPFQVIFLFFPYQLLLIFSSFRAIIRLLSHDLSWEKTQHYNLHRPEVQVVTST